MGDNVTLIAGVLKRKCESADPYECSEYSQNLQSSALMEIPKSAMSPVSSLSGPSYVSICSDILFKFGHTSNHVKRNTFILQTINLNIQY